MNLSPLAAALLVGATVVAGCNRPDNNAAAPQIRLISNLTGAVARGDQHLGKDAAKRLGVCVFDFRSMAHACPRPRPG